jgi:DNA polymerase-3 subunit gamma/tau
MLGTLDRSHAPRLLTALADGDGAALLAALAEANAQAADPGAVLDELLRLLHQIALCQAVPGAALAADADPTAVQALAARLPAEDVQLYYQMALLGRRDLPLAPDPASGLEMLMLRLLVFRPAGDGVDETASAPRRAPAERPAAQPQRAVEPAPPPADAAPRANDTPTVPAAARRDDDWSRIVPRLGLRGAAQQLAQHCVLRRRRDAHFELAVDARSRSLLTPTTREVLTDALSKLIGQPAQVDFGIETDAADTPAQRLARAEAERAVRARTALEDDPVVRGLMHTLDARLIDGTASGE